MTSIASQMKDLKRRGLQKVLQQMGMAEKTNDESISHPHQSFVTLGNFLSHVKQSVQGANQAFEKMAKSQSNMASSLHAYIHTELADDADSTTGELTDFLNTQEEDSSVHAVMLQELSERFYYACNDITNTVLSDMMLSLEEFVVKPIARDEDQNVQTKELIEERKRLNLDYDAYRRAANNASHPSEQEKNEAKLRAAKDKFEACSKKVNEHLALRNYKRSKVIIHSILTVMQQYNKFFIASAAVLGEVAGILTPLLEHYQMDERQFMEMMRMDVRPVKPPAKDGASVPPASKPPKRDSPPPSPHQKPAQAPPPNPKPSRVAPSSPPLPREPLRETPNGHSNGAAAQSKPAPLFDDLMGDHGIPTSIPNPTPAPTPAPAPAPAAAPNLIDPDWDIGGTTSTPASSNTSSKQKDATFVDLNFDTSPPPTNSSGSSQSSNLFGGDPFDIFGQTPMMPQQAAAKPSPTQIPKPTSSPFTTPPPQHNFFKPAFNGQPQYNNMPPNFGGKPAPGPTPGYFGAQPPPGGPYGQGGMPGAMPGGMPGGMPGYGGFPQQPGYAPRPGGFNNFASGPSGPNPYANPPNAGVSFVQQTEGLDSATSTKLRQWAERGGKKQNLRALISTMHEVLWTDSGWEQKGLGELVSPAQVKKAYRQATLIVHPDKIASCTEEQKIIAKKVFESLSESYEVFKNEPQ